MIVADFRITTTADNITFSDWRYLGIRAALVMEVDNDVATYDYEINYKCGGSIVKTVSGNVAENTVISVLESFYEGGKKYVTDGGQASSLTVTSSTTSLNINVTEASQYTCTVNAKAGDVLLAAEEESVYDGDNVTVYYQMAYAKDGKWYFIDKNGSAPGYGVVFNGVTSNQTENKTTYVLNEDLVYFGEAEDMTLSGSFAANGNYLDWRSNGMAKRLAAGAYIYSDIIAPGVYDVTLWARNNRSAGDGTETLPIFLRDGEGNLTDLEVSFPGWNRGGYEDAKTATITIPNDSKDYSIVINNNTGYTSNLELDYMYVAKKKVSATIPTSGYGTIASAYPLDCANLPDGLKAYQVTGLTSTTVTLEEVKEAVAANTGLILKGTAGQTYNIPVAATGTDISAKNKLKAAVTATTLDDGSFYILKSGKFCKVEGAADEDARTVPAGKAYLLADDITGGARSLNFTFDATAIKAVEGEIQNGEFYNVAGQRVAQPTKGLYIVNGKKIVVK